RYLPLTIGQQVRPDDLSTLPVYQLLKRSTGAQVSRIVSTALSVGASLELARVLRVRKGHPLLMREQTYFADNDLPLMHGVIAFRGDRYRFIFECGPGQLRMDATTGSDQTRLIR
ncbi:MAG: UTRA domain-containing protein, partial [Beijerinckiaceae bacterium]